MKKLWIRLLCLFLFITAIFLGVDRRSAISVDPEASNVVVYNYSAKEIISNRKTGVTTLKGDVKVTKVTTNDSIKNGQKKEEGSDYLNADQVVVYKNVETGELIKIEAEGKVSMKEGDMVATCSHAIIYEAEERIEMDGSPATVDDGKNKIEAPAITYFRKEDRLEAKGEVRGHITIEEKEEGSEESGKQ